MPARGAGACNGWCAKSGERAGARAADRREAEAPAEDPERRWTQKRERWALLALAEREVLRMCRGADVRAVRRS